MLNLDRWKTLRAFAVAGVVVAALAAGGAAQAITAVEHFERAQRYFDKGELDASIIELKNALQQDRENAAARLLLARAYILSGHGTAAAKELERAEKFGMAGDDLRELKAQAQLLQGNFQAALENLSLDDSAQEIPPARRAMILELTGQAQLGLGNRDAAERSFADAIELDGRNAAAHAGLGRIAMQDGAFDAAEAALAKALAADAGDQNALRLKGDLAFSRGDYGPAEVAYQELTDAYPFIPNVVRLAFARSSLRKFDESNTHLEQILKVAPTHPGANYLRALNAYQTKDFDTAKFHIGQALSAAEQNPQFQLLAGATHYALGENQQALRYLERYLDRVPDDDRARRLLGVAQLRAGDAKSANRTLKPLEGNLATDDAEMLALIGTAAVRAGDLASGRQYLERLSQAQPDNPAVRAQLGAVAIALGDADAGISDLERALEQDPSLDRALLSLIVALIREREFDRALDAAERLQQSNPANAQAHTLVGIAHGGVGDIDAATRAFEQAIELDQRVVDARANLAALKVAHGDLEAARTLYLEVLDIRPDHLMSLLRLAELERRLERPAEELKLLQRALGFNSRSVQARLALARAYVTRRAPRQALKTLAGMPADIADNPAVLEVAGEAQLQTGDIPAALHSFRRLTTARPDSAAAHFRLARAQDAAQNFKEADAALEQTLLLDPSHTQAKFARARILIRQGDLELAERLVGDLAASAPGDTAVLELQTRLALAQNRASDAVELLRAALETNQTSALVILLAQIEAQTGGVESGLATLDGWISRYPDDVRVRTYLAQSYLSLERFGDAENQYQSILTAAPNDIGALNNLAWIKWHDGKPQEGLVHARRALNLAPDNPGIMDTLGIILLEAGESSEALSLLRRAYQGAPENSEIQLHFARALVEQGYPDEARPLLTELAQGETDTPQKTEAENLLKLLP